MCWISVRTMGISINSKLWYVSRRRYLRDCELIFELITINTIDLCIKFCNIYGPKFHFTVCCKITIAIPLKSSFLIWYDMMTGEWEDGSTNHIGMNDNGTAKILNKRFCSMLCEIRQGNSFPQMNLIKLYRSINIL